MTRKRLIQFVALLGIAGLAAGGAWALWLRPMEVQIVNTSHDVPIQVFGLGTVEAQIRSKIGFEAAGTLVELHADHGDSVEKGQLLARLDSREQAARVAQARANVSQTEAAVEQSAADVERAEAVLKEKRLTNERRQELMRRGTTSQQLADESQAAFDIAKADLTKARSAVTVAKANLEQASATLAREEVRLAKHTLDSPYDGIIIKRHHELGSALNANEAVFTIVDPQTTWALAYIDEARAGAIEVGQPAEVVRRSAPEVSIAAKVERIEIESDRVNEEYRVYVRCGGCPLEFHLGEQAEVRITVATLSSARLVPMNALSDITAKKATAWTVEDGRLKQRRISIGHRTLDGRAEIADGGPEGAEIVRSPTTGLGEGDRAVIVAGKEQ